MEFNMSERMNVSILIRAAQIIFWACLFLLIIVPTSTVYGQDSEDDVEEYFGEDDEYEDDEYEDDEYLEDGEYDDEEYDDEDEYDEEYDDEDEYDEDEEEDPIEDIAENLGYTIDLALGSPRFTNRVLMDWTSAVDIRASVEFPILMQLLGANFRFGAEVGSFKFENAIPKEEADGSLLKLGEKISGITAMGIVSFPAGPGKIKFGAGIVGSSPGFSMEASYGIRIGEMVEIRGGIRSTETLNAKTSESNELGRAGWMDGQIVLGVNL
jgi:hypothetical protein